MKSINKIFIATAVAASMGLGACTDDLNQMPTDPSTITAADFSKDPEGYMNRVLADVYLQFATYGANGDTPVKDFDSGMAAFQRAMFIAEEIPTDEACWLWDPDKYGNLNYGLVTSDVSAVLGFYSRLMINITLCNDFIQTVQSNAFGLNDSQMAMAQDYIRQCKILRAGCYFYFINFFGDVPYADETTPIGATPAQLPRAEVFNLVTASLEEIVKEFEPNQKPHYGFVGLDVAESLLVKFYLNAEVFTGSPMYDKCYAHAKNVIDRLGHGGHQDSGLAEHYVQLFAANNKQYAIGGANAVNEIIWTIPQDRIELTSYSGAAFLLSGWVGTNGVTTTVKAPVREDYDSQEAYDEAKKQYDKDASDPDKKWTHNVDYVFNNVDYAFDPKETAHIAMNWYNINDGWKCMVARESFVKKFEWTDPGMSVSKDTRVALWRTSKDGFTSSNPNLSGSGWGANGYLAPKYTNFAIDANGEIDNLQSPPASDKQACGDYGVIRLAEIYLSAAEAIMNGGGGSQADALKYVNFIRTRAGVDPFTTLTTENLRDERCRELYQESTRRTDLIRYGQWCYGYTWEWKGGSELGRDLPEYTKLYPYPSNIITASGYKQNPGY